MASVRRVLIIKMSAMGDIIHALPVSAALGEAFPQIELTWAVEEAFAPMVTGNPYLTDVLTLPKMRSKVRVRGRKLTGFLDARRHQGDCTISHDPNSTFSR